MAELEDTPEEQAPDTEETIARKQGWVSQEEWSEQGKEPEEWIPATRFNARGDFLGEIKRYRSQVEELEGKVSNFGELMTEQVKATREAALKEVESRHRQVWHSASPARLRHRSPCHDLKNKKPGHHHCSRPWSIREARRVNWLR